jgi:Concanavalin A-like lectin/glucanases superfamily
MTGRRALFGLTTLLAAVGVSTPAAVRAAACGGGTTACGASTSVTYNGLALTFYGAATNGTVRSELWYLKAPPSGTHNVVVTAPVPTALTATSMSFTGVNQTTPLGTLASGTGTGTAPSLSVSSVVGEPVFDVLGAVGTTTPTVAGPTQTVRQTNNTSSGVDHVVIGSSTAPGAAAAVTMSWTIASADYAQVAVPIKASTALTDVTVESFTATAESNDVLLRWTDGYEPHALGFYVYRSDSDGDRVQLNSDIIPGGALAGTVSSFSWTDASPGWNGASVSYWIKDVDVDGSFTWYGQARPATPGSTSPDAAWSAGGATGTGRAPAAESSAGAGTPPTGGCALVARGPSGAAVQLLLVLGLIAGGRRRKHRFAVAAIYLVAIVAAGIWLPRTARGAGGVAVDASATGTGASGLSFSHTMGAGANGLLLVGVVMPVTCANTTNDSGNCAACGSTCAGNTTGSVASGLLGLWHLDEGAGTTSADASGNGNTASLLGSPSWTTGYEGDALQLNGSSSYVQASTGSGWFGGNNTLTAAAWVYVTANTNGPVFGVTTIPVGGGWNMPFLSVNGATVYGWLWQVNGNNPLSTTVSLNAWHHLAITYDPTAVSPTVGREIFYVDGAQVATGTGTYSPSGLTDYFSTLIGGAKPSGVNSYLLGRIDEPRTYNRVLSAAEISTLATARLSCSASSCAACPMGLSSCGGSCVNETTDASNCGSCGHACNSAGGETCVAGTCTCTSGTDCSGTCVDTTSDANNCNGCNLACGMPTSSGVDSGLVGRWHLDEGSGSTSADSSGNGNTATLTSSPTWTSGYSSYGLSCDGVSSYVSANLGTWFGGNNTLTASAWVYATSSSNGPVFGVTSIPAGGGWNMPFLSIAGSTVYGWLWQVNGNNPLSATVGLNAWHFLAITYDPSGSGTEKFYVDGALSASGTGTYSPSGLTDSWSTDIPGAKPSGVNSFLGGKIDEVRAYKRVLSASEISILYYARQTCSASTCGGCAGGEALCSGACTNKAVDTSNCGTCGTTCNTAGGESCISSACGCATGTDCSGVCADTTSDQNNCGSCGHACGATTCGSCDSGMAGLWHLDEGSGSTSADASGNGNTATLVSSPAWTTGESNDALTFNGSSSYLYATLGTWFGGNNTLTASAWVYATSTTNGPVFGVAQSNNGTNWDMPFLSINGSTVYGWLWQVNGNTPLSATVSLNAWHLLTITYDPASGGTERFYVDGALSSSGTGTYSPSGLSDFVTTIIQGAKPSGVNSFLKGTVDELRAYTRVLSAGEIALLYNPHQTCSGSSCGGCPSGTTSCGGVCTNTAADSSNCNGCGNVCPGAQKCVSGACM